jgi:predicted short-subunit dehydrogenase-like oxidoreductase (DUF2520 family)
MRIAIVGRGRLGRSLAHLLGEAGHEVGTSGRGEAVADAEVVLLCVPDAELAGAASRVPPGPVVLHCSGAVEVDVLRPHRPAGSLHPLMTFPGPEVALPDLRGVPAAVAGDPEAVALAGRLAGDLGLVPFAVPGDRRLYHAAAVLAGNFATVLLGEAARVLVAAGVDPAVAPSVLVPLALRSVDNARHGASRALTGPVARGDERTLAAHRAALEEAGLSEVLVLYDALLVAARRHRAEPGQR